MTMISLTTKPDCTWCEQASGALDMGCYGCCVRYAARQMKPGRMKIYAVVQAEHGEAVMRQFIADIRTYREARKALGTYA